MKLKTVSINLCIVLLFTISCTNKNNTTSEQKIDDSTAAIINKTKYLEHIADLENRIHNSNVLNDTLAVAMIKAYSSYAYSYERDSLSPDYLFKAAELSVSVKQFESGITYYQAIIDKYPNFKYSKEAYYLIAFIYDTYINDDTKAKQYYEELIQKYPDSKLADDAHSALLLLGKSDEQIIKEFEKKNKKNP